ncbi:glycophorin-C isoform X2 [Gorilla gorilla gorilla]|uniref:glycophorin-C isoform X2 n=2 Tax=Gorilla gorilla gorilla TaxID=9595 RepID=UPI00123EA88F|nr:glycophorin-C isoform X4 [Gorilla gorilla gorilla]
MASASTTMHTATIAEPDPGMASASTTMHTATIAEPDPGMAGWLDGLMEASSLTITDIVIIASVIAAVAIVLISLLFVMLRYMFRHKGTYHTNEAKGTEFAESADAALQDDPALQDAGDSSRKEYFI